MEGLTDEVCHLMCIYIKSQKYYKKEGGRGGEGRGGERRGE